MIRDISYCFNVGFVTHSMGNNNSKLPEDETIETMQQIMTYMDTHIKFKSLRDKVLLPETMHRSRNTKSIQGLEGKLCFSAMPRDPYHRGGQPWGRINRRNIPSKYKNSQTSYKKQINKPTKNDSLEVVKKEDTDTVD